MYSEDELQEMRELAPEEFAELMRRKYKSEEMQEHAIEPYDTTKEMEAVVCITSWGGRREYPCRVICETPKHYRIDVCEPVALPPGFTILLPGQTTLVPKHAIRFRGRRIK